MALKTLGETFAAVMTAVAALLAVGCGWEGEPVIDSIKGDGADTAYNDLTYTAVTGNVSSVSAIGADLRGFINTTEGFKEATTEIGFLLSRFKTNPSYGDAADQDSTDRGRVRLIKVYDVASDNSIKARVTGLIPYTKFYFRTYAILRNGETVYGVAKEFMTQNLTLTITDPPQRIGLFDADLTVKVGGLSATDYGTTANMRFRCADAPMASPTTPIAEEHQYDKTTPATPSAGGASFKTTVNGLTPGRRYYALAYMDIKSDFYDMKTDNPEKVGAYAYGTEARSVETDKYHSQTIEIRSTALTGVRSFTGEQATVDYDAVTIGGSYFTLPTDTLSADSYGVLISTLPTVPTDSAERWESQSGLTTGNRYSVFANKLSLNTQYYYKAYVEIRGVTICSQTICEFATKDYAPIAVDLGLSVLWADRNVGSYAQELAGGYFSWGETGQKDEYTDETFVGAGVGVSEIGGTAYDVATCRWGEGWRLPSREEVNELFDKCDWKWTRKNGVAGYEITATSENKIFIPASGLKLRSKVEDFGQMGYYWTSERGTGGNTLGQVYDMYFRQGMKTDESKRPIHTCTPAVGLCVRAVFDKTANDTRK